MKKLEIEPWALSAPMKKLIGPGGPVSDTWPSGDMSEQPLGIDAVIAAAAGLPLGVALLLCVLAEGATEAEW